jgi:hypothetical protein
MKNRLEQVLMNAFSSESHPLLFSGCYFAATGLTPDQQGFVRGFMDKLIDEQELLEWTKEAKNEDRKIRWLSRIGWLTCLIGIGFVSFIGGRLWLQWW